MPFLEQRLVLCIDDDEYVLDVFRAAFKDQPHFILDVATKVETAIEKIMSIFYDLIFIDMKLNGVSLAGMKILEALREVEVDAEARGKPVKFGHVVIMSGSVCLDDFSKKANELDVFSFVNKPLHLRPEFVKRVMRKVRPLMPMV